MKASDRSDGLNTRSSMRHDAQAATSSISSIAPTARIQSEGVTGSSSPEVSNTMTSATKPQNINRPTVEAATSGGSAPSTMDRIKAASMKASRAHTSANAPLASQSMLLMAKPVPNSTTVKHRRPYARLAHPA